MNDSKPDFDLVAALREEAGTVVTSYFQYGDHDLHAEAADALEAKNREIESIREERDALRKSWNYCKQLADDARNDFGEPPLVDGRDLYAALGLA